MAYDVKSFLDLKADQYNRPEFIENDPISIPHLFTQKQDVEIMGFFASILAWGQRKTIINKCKELAKRMDGTPYDFVVSHQETDLKALLGFKHRTFNDTDLLYFISFFQQHYKVFSSLEDAFLPQEYNAFSDEFINGLAVPSENPPCYLQEVQQPSIASIFNHFRSYFFSLPNYPQRTLKHVSSPLQKSTCKRLNMFLRWMVRKDDKGVDFGIWNRIKPSQLICPCDVHVERVSRKLGLITRKQVDWQTAMELTQNLRRFDPIDPVKYDFALFGLGIEEKF